ncbi:MAG: precorrin-3B synthase, partial [Methyloceanibacter sp.]
MTEIRVRGACPSLPQPMETGDGLLARLVVAAPIPLDDFLGLCAAARTHGNGTMEISARGNLQVRGLTPLSTPRFAATISALDIEISDGVPVLADPLPDDPAALIDANGVAAELCAAIHEARLTLAPKVSVVVDCGGSIDLDAIAADIRLRAVTRSDGIGFALALAGDAASAVPLASIATEDAVAEVLALLGAIAALGPEARAADLPQVRAGRQSYSAAFLPAKRAHPIGRHPLRDGAFALGLGLAFGHSQASALSDLARTAKENGADWARPAPDRALLFGPLG